MRFDCSGVGSYENEQILCGDFNTPKFESSETGLVTFGQNINKNGKVITKKSFRNGLGSDWDKGERSLFSSSLIQAIASDFFENDLVKLLHPETLT